MRSLTDSEVEICRDHLYSLAHAALSGSLAEAIPITAMATCEAKLGGDHQCALRRREEPFQPANALKSTGPLNTISTRCNATKHGLLSQGVTELDLSDYRKLVQTVNESVQPDGRVE